MFQTTQEKVYFFLSLFLLVVIAILVLALLNQRVVLTNERAEAFYNEGFVDCKDAVGALMNDTTNMFDLMGAQISNSPVCVEQLQKAAKGNITFFVQIKSYSDDFWKQLNLIEAHER